MQPKNETRKNLSNQRRTRRARGSVLAINRCMLLAVLAAPLMVAAGTGCAITGGQLRVSPEALAFELLKFGIEQAAKESQVPQQPEPVHHQ